MNHVNIVYIIDSSSFIHLRRINPIDIYETPWNRLKELIIDRRLITHSEVKSELTDGDDFLSDWIRELDKEYDWIFGISDYQNAVLPEIQSKYPRFIKYNSEHDADPFVVALALQMIRNPSEQTQLVKNEYIVVSNEKRAKNRNLNNPPEVVKIPDFCDVLEIRCIDIFDLFRGEKWIF